MTCTFIDLHKKGISNDQYEMSADPHHFMHYLNRLMTITKEQPCKLKNSIDGQIILPDNC